ncbi:hypothetical protein C8P63_11031 [Melghirimyces profundicolus]|uniref:YIEGIA protein n=1 Tax=Melghirimyces profundicolus TaxID=1242148 RepID=A0A2T6BV88_9BACL|nr:YIEGIA family protein [Melghirimyces profundicolus]PTX59887.1 hypothetical protein C8P63_11031 [Melghirimyces profundicolus]
MTHSYTMAVVFGLIAGFLCRIRMLRTDFRQYPTYPHGRVIHLSLGLIAAGLGAVAVPALFEKNYTAITFLALAAQQFREVRNMERETLSKLDEMELVKRGATYIEGIAMVFEGRNFLVILSAFLTSLAVMIGRWPWGILVGLVVVGLTGWLRSGKSLDQIADVQIASVRLKGPNLYVDDIYIMNIGLEDNRRRIREHGVGVVVVPKDRHSRFTLANTGQRQAILHDVSVVLGVFRDTGEPSLVPLIKRDLNDGRLGVFLLPEEKDPEAVLEVVRRVPVLESAVRMPLTPSRNQRST